MNTPDITAIRNAGYRMTANADANIVSRCAEEVLRCYILHFVTQADVTAATVSDEIGKAWIALTFLRYTQDVEFGTRTGGERKRFEYGEHLEYMKALKGSCAEALLVLNEAHEMQSKITDVCGVFFKTQLFN